MKTKEITLAVLAFLALAGFVLAKKKPQFARQVLAGISYQETSYRDADREIPGTAHFRNDTNLDGFLRKPTLDLPEPESSETDAGYEEFDRLENDRGFAKTVELPEVVAPQFESPREKNCGEYIPAALLAGIARPLSEAEFNRLGTLLNGGIGVTAKRLIAFLSRYMEVRPEQDATLTTIRRAIEDAHPVVVVVRTEDAAGRSNPHWAAVTGFRTDRNDSVTEFRIVDNGLVGEWIDRGDFAERWNFSSGGWHRYALVLRPKEYAGQPELADNEMAWHKSPRLEPPTPKPPRQIRSEPDAVPPIVVPPEIIRPVERSPEIVVPRNNARDCGPRSCQPCVPAVRCRPVRCWNRCSP